MGQVSTGGSVVSRWPAVAGKRRRDGCAVVRKAALRSEPAVDGERAHTYDSGVEFCNSVAEGATTLVTQTTIVRALRNGQVTIPIEFRRRLGIDEQSVLEISVDRDELRIRPVRLAERERAGDTDWFERLYEHFAPARAEAIEKGYTEEDINEWIDAAVAAVRANDA